MVNCVYFQAAKAMTIHKWSGIGDGRFPSCALNRLLETDDHYLEAKRRILHTEILVIDEISMLSKKIFELLEETLRYKDPSLPFGGIQIVLVGDFLQLPPVKNIRYGDLGDFCFNSAYFPKHLIYLSEVFRQHENDLISLIHSLSLGRINEGEKQKLQILQRPLPFDELSITHLFATNMLADIYNRDCILKHHGDLYTFESSDSGEPAELDKMVVQKILWLKVGIKVILLRNISDVYVNGLLGDVTSVSQDVIQVFFPSVGAAVDVKRFPFAGKHSIFFCFVDAGLWKYHGQLILLVPFYLRNLKEHALGQFLKKYKVSFSVTRFLFEKNTWAKTVWTQIRLLLYEQSDLGPRSHCYCMNSLILGPDQTDTV